VGGGGATGSGARSSRVIGITPSHSRSAILGAVTIASLGRGTPTCMEDRSAGRRIGSLDLEPLPVRLVRRVFIRRRDDLRHDLLDRDPHLSLLLIATHRKHVERQRDGRQAMMASIAFDDGCGHRPRQGLGLGSWRHPGPPRGWWPASGVPDGAGGGGRRQETAGAHAGNDQPPGPAEPPPAAPSAPSPAPRADRRAQRSATEAEHGEHGPLGGRAEPRAGRRGAQRARRYAPGRDGAQAAGSSSFSPRKGGRRP
jgi:hypothetical protein